MHAQYNSHTHAHRLYSGVYRHSNTDSNPQISSLLGREGLQPLLHKYLPHVAATTVLFNDTVFTIAHIYIYWKPSNKHMILNTGLSNVNKK